jgi:hypothetical protein
MPNKLTYERIESILDMIVKLHKSFKKQVDFKVEDKKQAFYIIQGGAITFAYTALKFHKDGLIVPMMQLHRMLNECVELTAFFEEVDDKSRQLKAWYSGKIIERQPGNSGNLSYDERAKRNNMEVDLIKFMDAAHKKLNDWSSQYSHPSMQALRTTMGKKSKDFDYQHKASKVEEVTLGVFVEFFIFPLLFCMLIPARTLTYSEGIYNIYRGLIDDLQKDI